MAPRRKAVGAPAPPSPPPLDGCVIVVCGTIPGKTQAAIQKTYIVPLGASLARSISSDTTTHVVSTATEYSKQTAKIRIAIDIDIPIVSLRWLQDCLTMRTRLDEAAYRLDTPSQSQATSQANGSRKRSADQSPPDDNADDVGKKLNPKKKTKSSKSEPVSKDEPEPEPEKIMEEKPSKVADGQIAKSGDVRIPVDDGSATELPNYEVYIDDGGVIYDASLNQTNASNNNNKFYRVQLLRSVVGDYRTWTRWGRVGEYGTSKALGNGTLADALKEFDSKFKAKSGITWADRGEPPKPGKYAFIERSYEPDSDEEEEEKAESNVKKENEEEPVSNLPKATQELMQLIFNQQYFAATMADLNYDAKKLPLGKLSKTTITRGYQALKDLAALLDDQTLAASKYGTTFPQAAEQLSNLFFTLIPHAFGRRKPPVIQSKDLLKKEIELLESLGDMKDAAALMKGEKSEEDKEELNKLDRQFRGLGMNEMTPLSQTSSEFAQLKDYLMDTRGATHNAKFTITQIFRIERQGETDRLETTYGTPTRNRRLLWHGSRCTNFGGILSQGLRIAPPEAPVSGYMFGKGIYLADMSSKSAGYCSAYSSNGHALLLLCEAELGDPIQELTCASYNAGDDAKAKGMLSTWGQGNTGPSKWKNAGCVHPSLQGVQMPDTSVKPAATGVQGAHLLYNEYICYDVSQVRLRYLFRVRM